jgi:mannose-6-phosphate isomerase-like protein (cupin superfamily)
MVSAAARTALDTALAAARACHEDIPELSAFVDWPADLRASPRPARHLPAGDQLQGAEPSIGTRRLRDALIDIAPFVEWRHTYTEAEVGAHFLDHYGWFELAGHTGHFHSETARITVAFWGPGLYYGWHHHRAEELYLVVAGHAMFETPGTALHELGPGQTQFHASNEPHSMTTTDSAILTLVLWRGEGLADDPAMT